MTRVVAVTALGATLVAAGAAAHSPTAAAVVAALDAPEARAAFGIAHAERDRANPRVLVVRVGPAWFALEDSARVALASRWRDEWRDAVPQGVVAVLDTRTETPVVVFGRGGSVSLRALPPHDR